MPMMITVAVVVAHHPAVISCTKIVIDESQVVLGDRAARVLPYLFADESSSESAAQLGSFVHNLAQPPVFSPMEHSTDRALYALSVAQDSPFQHSSRKP